MEEKKRVPNYNPREDDRVYDGTKLLDAIETGASRWYQDERTLEGWEYLNPFSVATATAIRGVEGVGWVLGNTPVAGDLLRGIGWAEDRLVEGARNVSGVLTPNLDPRFAGWGTRLGTAILADKGLRKANVAGKLAQGYSKVKGAVKETIEEGVERAAVRSGKKYTSTRPETMSNIWKNEDITGPRKTYERYSKKGYYPETPLSNLWDDTPEMTKPQSTAYGDDLSVVPTDDLKGLETVSKATGEPIDVIALREGLLNRIDGTDLPIEDTIRRGSKGEVVQNPFLTIYKREDAAWIGQGLQSAVPVKPTAATIWDNKMDDIYKLLTGQDPDLPTAGAKELQKIKLHRAKGSKEMKFIKHHPAPLAHVARGLDYLTDDGVRAGAAYLSRRIGNALGDFQPGVNLEDKFHSKMHRFLDDKLGSSKGGLLYKLEKKYKKAFGGKKLSEGVSLQVRIESGFMDELADVIIEQKGFIDDWYRALANRAEVHKVSIEEYINEAANTAKADEVLKAILAGKRTRGKGISDLVDEVIGRENKILRDIRKDYQQLENVDDLRLSKDNIYLKKLLRFNLKKEFVNELMNMDWANTSIADSRKKVLKLIDDYDLPFETKKFTPEQVTDQIVESLHNKDISESITNPEIAKEITDWVGRD